MEQTPNSSQNPTAGKTLGMVGMILGIVAVVLSFIPCLGMYALIPGVIGLILSIVSISQAGKVGAPKGMAIAGIACSIVGCAIAGWQWYAVAHVADAVKDEFEKSGFMDSLNKAAQQLKELKEIKELPADTTSGN